MSLFQNSVLKKYINLQDKEAIKKAFNKYVDYFHNTEIQENIRESKEEQFQEGFLRELFVNVLDYTLNPKAQFNLTTEFKNEKGAKKADGAILKEGKALAVIELKSTKTKDLEKVRQQAFDYKANQSACVYVITSNFEKLRFYINNAVDFKEFNLFTLNKDQFELLYLCLHKENILQNIPLKIKTDSVVAEETITKTFYSDYSQFKRELFRDLVKKNLKNEIFRTELQKEDKDRVLKNIKQGLFKKSQKLIDRFLFIFFAEDKGLLPPNSTLQILNKWQADWDFGDERPLYDLFKQYFNFLDIGRKGTQTRAEIFAYNGGLFKPDPILDSLILDNQLLFKHTKKLSDYDFESQVGVNILGHIFENSLNEIESVNAEIEGKEFDKQKTKRKKDGVFYTPKYITKYIVDNTIGKLCKNKKQELEIEEAEYQKSRKGRKKETLKKLKTKLDNYRNWLLTLTILDPACGSGAFLNQALDFLIKEHTYIDELETLLVGGGIVFRNIENTILENNIYGVDLNEESVEIAKLSLWLRTAQPRRKLNTLNDNIKCGNSLIDDPKVAGDKAFNWQKEFLKIFENGGFDIIIGNPPYGAKFSITETKYYNKRFIHQSYQLDSYLLFTENIKTWLKFDGIAGYIMPNTWLSSLFGSKIRNFVLNEFIIQNLVHYNYFVFDDATVETDTYIFQNRKPDKKSQIQFVTVDKIKSEQKKSISQIDWIKLNGEPINIYETKEVSKIKNKLSKSKKLGDLVQIVQGTKPFQKGKGKPKQTKETMDEKPFVSETKKDDTFLPLLRGSLINKYSILWNSDYWISYGDWLAEPRYSAKFDCEEKLVIRQTGDSLITTYDNQQFIARDNLYIIRDDAKTINIKGLLAILNSKFLNWFFQSVINPERGKAMAQVKRGHLQQLPIVESDLSSLTLLSNLMLSLNKELQKEKSNFLNTLKEEKDIEKITKKIDAFYNFEYDILKKELAKQKVKLALGNENNEWREYFNKTKQKINDLQNQISQTDNEIDKKVYELYELTEEEIEIVESSVK